MGRIRRAPGRYRGAPCRNRQRHRRHDLVLEHSGHHRNSERGSQGDGHRGHLGAFSHRDGRRGSLMRHGTALPLAVAFLAARVAASTVRSLLVPSPSLPDGDFAGFTAAALAAISLARVARMADPDLAVAVPAVEDPVGCLDRRFLPRQRSLRGGRLRRYYRRVERPESPRYPRRP